MVNWFKNMLMALVAFAASWSGAIWFWRANNRVPVTQDLVIYLLLVPVGLLLAWWLAKLVYRRATAIPALPAAAAPGASPDAAAAPKPIPNQALTIVAAALRSPHGGSAHELAALLAARKARPNLDPELYDDSGYPIMSARIGDLDTGPLQEEMADWFIQDGMPAPRYSTEQWRALAAGGAVVTELAVYLAGHQQLPEYSPIPPPCYSTAAGRQDDTDISAVLPMLQLMAVCPSDWQPAHRQAAAYWFRHLIVRAGWPLERIAPLPDTPDHAGDATDVYGWAPLAALLAAQGRAVLQRDENRAGSTLAMVVACASALGEASVERLNAEGSLFTAAHAQGRIPGEGAAGLLLTDQRQAAMLPADESERIELQAVRSGLRGTSADQGKRVDGSMLRALSEQTMRDTACAPEQITAIVADSDHRTSRVMELISLATELFPDLDHGADMLSIGAACGSCGAVGYVTALAAARQLALERNGAVLCAGNQDALRRCVALLRPVQPEFI